MVDLSNDKPSKGVEDVPFDGVICFGGVDWWYHNHGHYDLQMMREFSTRVPVLYVNSIGMRPPRVSEGAMFFRRVLRKLKSLGHGLVRIRKNFNIYSPITLPGGGQGAIASAIARKALTWQVRLAARRCGIRRPMIWVACPPAAGVIDDFNTTCLLYQRTDRFEDFKGVDVEKITGFDQKLKRQADLVLFCSRELYDKEKDDCREAAFIDHGVDYERFEAAAIAADQYGEAPSDVADLPRPRVGFIGGLDSHTFDPPFFVEVARSLPDVQFILVGGSSLPEGWCPLPNVHLLGQRPYDQVAAYMAASDVLIMPWNRSEWIQACNPVKMKEYLAVGRPVVSTYFREVEYYSANIDVATEVRDFVAAIKAGLDNPGDCAARRDRVKDHTWAAKADLVWNAVASPKP